MDKEQIAHRTKRLQGALTQIYGEEVSDNNDGLSWQVMIDVLIDLRRLCDSHGLRFNRLDRMANHLRSFEDYIAESPGQQD